MDLSRVPFAYEDLKDFENRIIYYESSRGCPFSLYRKDRLWRSLELKNARTEAGTTTRRFLD